jgi:hypothetical protein
MNIQNIVNAANNLFPGTECYLNGETFNDIVWLQGLPLTESEIIIKHLNFQKAIKLEESETLANSAHDKVISEYLGTYDPTRMQVYLRKYNVCKKYKEDVINGLNPTIPTLIASEVSIATELPADQIIDLVIYMYEGFWMVIDQYLGTIEGIRRKNKLSIESSQTYEELNAIQMLDYPIFKPS